MDPFSQKLTSVLSASYSDADIRDALLVLDPRLAQNTPDSRRQLRVNVQADVIQTNAAIVREFSKIAEVCLCLTSTPPRQHCTEQPHWPIFIGKEAETRHVLESLAYTAIETDWLNP